MEQESSTFTEIVAKQYLPISAILSSHHNVFLMLYITDTNLTFWLKENVYEMIHQEILWSKDPKCKVNPFHPYEFVLSQVYPQNRMQVNIFKMHI